MFIIISIFSLILPYQAERPARTVKIGKYIISSNAIFVPIVMKIF